MKSTNRTEMSPHGPITVTTPAIRRSQILRELDAEPAIQTQRCVDGARKYARPDVARYYGLPGSGFSGVVTYKGRELRISRSGTELQVECLGMSAAIGAHRPSDYSCYGPR